MIERYAAQTGFDVTDADWYQAFAFFKLAVVCQGIAARAAGGAMLGSGFDDAQRLVAPLVDAGRHLLAVSARQRVRRQMDSGRLRSVGRCGGGGGGGGGVIGPTSRRRR